MIALVIIMNFFLALIFSFSKPVIAVLDPLFFLIIRMACGAGIFFLLHTWYESKVIININYVFIVLFLGLFNVYLVTAGQLWALQTLSGAQACLIFNCNPFIIVFLSYLFLREKITHQKIVGLILGWFGLFIALLPQHHGGFTVGAGHIAILAAAFATSISAILLQTIFRRSTYPLFYTTGASMAIGALFALLHVLFIGCPLLHGRWDSSLASAAALVTFATIICAGLYSYLLKFYSAGFLAFTGFMAPLCAAFFDWLLGQSEISWHFYGALVLIAAGLYIFYQNETTSADSKNIR